MKQKVKDLEFGFQSEDELFDFFNDNIGKCCKTPKFAIFDYEGDDFFIELKTRRINSKKFNSTFMNLNKLEEAERNNEKKNNTHKQKKNRKQSRRSKQTRNSNK